MTTCDNVFNFFAAIIAQWQEWGQWSQCSTSCGPGSKIRARACSHPTFGGDDQCHGNSTMAAPCKLSECQGMIVWLSFFYGGDIDVAATDAEWQDWGEWSQCTASCGQGSKVRARACSEPAFGGDEQCPGDYTELENCETSKCAGSSHRCSRGSRLLGQQPKSGISSSILSNKQTNKCNNCSNIYTKTSSLPFLSKREF